MLRIIRVDKKSIFQQTFLSILVQVFHFEITYKKMNKTASKICIYEKNKKHPPKNLYQLASFFPSYFILFL